MSRSRYIDDNSNDYPLTSSITRESDDFAMKSGAIFSACEQYRFRLWREWDASKPRVVFCMLNPSTATHTTIDNTIRGCLARAAAWGYGRLDVINLFALRSTDPRELALVADPHGPGNEQHIADACDGAGLVICGWGNNRMVGHYGAVILTMMRKLGVEPHALAINRNGSPKHPLYVSHQLKPVPLP